MKKIIGFVIIFILTINIAFSQNEDVSAFPVFLPQYDWTLDIDNNILNITKYSRENNSLYLAAMNEDSLVMMTIFFEKAESEGNSEVCREFYYGRLKQAPEIGETLEKIELFGNPAVKYTMYDKEREMNHFSYSVYYVVDSTWIDVHISRYIENDNDILFLENYIKSIKINIDRKRVLLLDLIIANEFYLDGKFKEAKKYLEIIHRKEKEKKTLEQKYTRVYIDYLSISYGMSGEMLKCFDLLEYAIMNDKEYPLNYYNLACAYAEMNDLDRAIDNLKIAFKYKNNVIDGEEMPDPETDSSFKKYLDNDKFKAFLNSIGK